MKAMKRATQVLSASAALAGLLLWAGGYALTAEGAPAVTVRGDAVPVTFAAAEIAQALRVSEAKELKEIILEVSGKGAAQSYRFSRPTPGALLVSGADACGAMYGGLDVAEAIRLGTVGDLQAGEHTAYIAQRGIKFNIPLDARTPSYSDAGDAAQQNIPEMWSLNFWHEFLDEMARDRFNVLSLWNLHPFPSMVKVPEYPDVALDDVMRTTVKFDSTYSTSGSDMVRPSHLANLERVKQLTIAQKIAFWRKVMQYAHDRGIEVYLFTWNIFTWGAEGKYGITSAQDNPVTMDYFRKSVRETLLTYPLLAGFGITAGEHMQHLKDKLSDEQWLWHTYGEGIRDVKKLQPDRSIRLIHRLHETRMNAITEAWKDYPGPFDFSYKYSVAHMYSSPTPPFAKPMLTELPAGMRTWMTVRNDDIYSFRWGDPEYARVYVKALPGPDKLAGYYMGPDGYIWGREFISTEPDTPRQLVIKKQWYSFMLWGRLSYEPTLPDALFQRALAARFPEAPGDKLFNASAAASKIIPQITRFFWGDIDVKWFPEGCLSRPGSKGWCTVKRFIEGDTMPGCGIVNIRAWREHVLAGNALAGITPLQVAEALETDARTTLHLLEAMPRVVTNKELRLTTGDLKAMAHLGNYYAEKIRGAADLALFDQSAQAGQRDSAVRHLETALEHWRRYAAIATSQYRPQLLTRVGYLDLNGLAENAAADIVMAKVWQPGTIQPSASLRKRAKAQPQAGAAIRIPRWQPHDFAFTNRSEAANPFQGPFSAEVTGPNQTRLVLPGFYDGDGTWKIRVSPTAEGKWQLVTHSTVPALDGQRIQFVCTPSAARVHGAVRVDSQHPHHFVCEDGTRFFPVGYECDWLWALDATNAELPTVNRFLDKLATNGFNYVLLNAYAHDTSWRQGKTGDDDYGPPPLYAWEGTNEQPDYSRFNLAYWQHYDRVMAALNERGMVAHVMIKVYNKMVNWPAKGSAEDDQYFRWLIARYCAYSNVHWDFSKESNNEKDLDYKLGRIRFIRDNDPYRRPITTHTDLATYNSGAYNGVLNYRSDQVHSKWHASLLEHRKQHLWPVLNVEFGYEHGPQGLEDKTYRVAQSPEEVCRRAWEVCLAGGYGAYYYTYTAWDIIRPDDSPPGYRYFRQLREFFDRTGYWRMEPLDGLVSEGFCLAEPGREYIVFLDKPASFTLRLEGLAAPAKAEWFHPFTGQRSSAGALANGVQPLTPPDNWGETPVVLHVTLSNPQGSIR
jgi:Protein of unknown function (DUF4038)/Domain of unknown function (DUF5060)